MNKQESFGLIVAGVGGQGAVTIAQLALGAAWMSGMQVLQSEVHGMSQRGGDVMSNLRISSDEIFSDLIPEGKADIIVGVEPMEALRHLPMLKPGGWFVTNSTPFVNIPNYPDIEEIKDEIKKMEKHVLINADKIAKDIGNARASNVVMLGAAVPFIGISEEVIIGAIKVIFGRKGDAVVNLNIAALKAGIAESHKVI